MTRRFYVFSKVFRTPLSTKAKLVYIYLCRMADHHAVSFPSRKTIGVACGLSVDSVKRATRELVENNFIEKLSRYTTDTGRQTSNVYRIIADRVEPYFYLESSIFDSDLPTNAKLVLAYINRQMEDTESCFPSYTDIAEACGITVPTARKYAELLVQQNYIVKERQYRDNGGNSNNMYMIKADSSISQTEKETPQPTVSCTVMVLPIIHMTKREFLPFFKSCTPPYENKAPP